MLENLTRRASWGFENPNEAAALIVMLILASWIFAFRGKFFFWISYIISILLLLLLLPTASRGGIVALFVGAIPLMIFSERPWQRKRLLAALAGFMAVLTVGYYHFPASKRLTVGIGSDDASISNRFLIWLETPRMMVDAPNGWGKGNASEAYHQWYQPIGEFVEYNHLVNSHLTWLVEHSWVERFLYLFCWLLILLVCFPIKSKNYMAAALAIWLSFSFACFFSNLADNWLLWLFPLLALSAVLLIRIRENVWPKLLHISVCCGVALSLVGVFYFLGSVNSGNRFAIKHDSGVTSINSQEGEIDILLYNPNKNLVGHKFGHDVREFFNYRNSKDKIYIRSVLVVDEENIDNLRLDGRKPFVVVSGSDLSAYFISELNYGTEAEIVTFNPELSLNEIQDSLDSGDFLTIAWGRFWNSGNMRDWLDQSNLGNIEFYEVRNASNYFPFWIDHVSDIVGDRMRANQRIFESPVQSIVSN